MASLGAQTLKVGTFQRHLLKRGQRKSAAKRTIVVGLMLTSMVDMFSLLVIFLLQTFSASPELVMITKGVSLPSAISAGELESAPVLSLTADTMFLDQHAIGKIKDILKDPTPLMEGLADQREVWEKTHPKGKFDGILNLQADRDLPSTTVSQILGLVSSQAYSSVQLAVVSRGGK